jgi:hypothetical protein
MAAERRHHDGDVGAHLGGLDGRAIRGTRRIEEQVARFATPPAITTISGSRMFTNPPIPTPSQRPTSVRIATETASPSRAAPVTIGP